MTSTSLSLHHQLSSITSLLKAFPPPLCACPSFSCCLARFYPAPSSRVSPVSTDSTLSSSMPLCPAGICLLNTLPCYLWLWLLRALVTSELPSPMPHCSHWHGCHWLCGPCGPPPGPPVPLTTFSQSPSVLELSSVGGSPPLLSSPLVGNFTLS